MLSKEVSVRIRDAVAIAGKYLESRLAPTAEHPTRNSYAHVWRMIKEEMGHSYKDCNDSDEQKIIEIIRKSFDIQ
jgi:hypothetical protein